MERIMKIFCDGSGWNGRESRWCVIVEGRDPIVQSYFDSRTNNEMEYRSVLYAIATSNKDDIILTDSQLVVNQVNGKWKVKSEHLKTLCIRAQSLLELRGSTLKWIPREENLAGKVFE